MSNEDWEMEWKDYYQILGIERNANPEEIHDAFIFYSIKVHPDKVDKSQKERATKEFQKFQEAYRNLKNPDKRCIYNSAWDNKNQSKDKNNIVRHSANAEPKPVVDSPSISFVDAEPGEIKKESFTIINNGGCFKDIWVDVDTPYSWLKVVDRYSMDVNNLVPHKVEIEAEGKDWDKSYFGYITVRLDEAETKVKVQLSTKHKPSQSKEKLSYYIKIFILIVALYYGFSHIPPILVEIQDVYSPSVVNDNSHINNRISNTDTKTAYTRDGIHFISWERAQENIKYEYAKPGDYKEVQVPRNTVIVGASVIPGEA